MEDRYQAKAIEEKWQRFWEENQTFKPQRMQETQVLCA